jgi:hypothetical protein
MGLLFLASNFISIYLGFSWQASSHIGSGHNAITATSTSEVGLSAMPEEREEEEDLQRLLITQINLTEVELQEVRYDASQLRQELEAAQELVSTLLEQSLSGNKGRRPKIGSTRRNGNDDDDDDDDDDADDGDDDDDDEAKDDARSDHVEADTAKAGAVEDDAGIVQCNMNMHIMYFALHLRRRNI